MEGAKIDKIGEMRFCLSDYRAVDFNQSVDCVFDLYGEPDAVDDVMCMETYWTFCRQFALAMGFGEKLVYDWFGDK